MEEITKYEAKFDYSELDKETADYLKQTAIEIKEDVESLATRTGERLFDAKDKLANHYHGTFQKWCEIEVGISPKTAYKLINRYSYVVNNIHNQNLLEELPLSLSYEISKPSAPPQLQAAVLSGDITTHKQYKELEKELKSRDSELKQIKDSYNQKMDKIITELSEKDRQLTSKNMMIQTLQKQQEEVKLQIKEVPVDNPRLVEKLSELDKDLDLKKQEVRRLQNKMNDLQKEAAKASEIENKERYVRELDERIDKAKIAVKGHLKELEAIEKVYTFNKAVKQFIKEHMIDITLITNITQNNRKELQTDLGAAIEMIENWLVHVKQLYKVS